MRVRQLHSFIAEQTKCLQSGTCEVLRGLRIGVEVSYWLRSIQMLKDPFADALGGPPPNLFAQIERELEAFAKFNIHPVFVFDGMVTLLSHDLFNSKDDRSY
jgi:hypothetical protein